MELEIPHPGSMYHIYNRGNNRENIFKEPRNYEYFLQVWKRYITPIANTCAYCLLPNHFHFLIEIIETSNNIAHEKEITQAFSNVFNSYTKSINKGHDRTGSLFQENYKRKLIIKESYFTQLVFYIHGNPQKHGLISDFTAYPHSSYRSILSDKPTLLCRDKVLEWFGGRGKFKEYHEGYQKFLSDNNLSTKNL